MRKTSPTPGFKAVLVAEAPYRVLKQLQSHESCGHLPFRFDLKDITNAAMELVLEQPDIEERILKRAYENVVSALTAIDTSRPVATPTKE